jgi:hypothetical protein
MFLVMLLMSGAFVADNQEFIEAVAVDLEAGKTWTYVGSQPVPKNGVAIPAIDSVTGKEVVYFVTK